MASIIALNVNDMSKAEEQALKAYPRTDDVWGDEWQKRVGFKDGYEQATKDLALTWEDIQRILDAADQLAVDYGSEKLNEIGYEDYCKEVLEKYLSNRRNLKERTS